MSERSAKLARARSYPYPYPGRSFTWNEGRVEAFDPRSTAGRTPVLAVGSNRAPDQLTRKYQGRGCGPIPVQHARLRDFDIVYAAHLTRYGAVPAMLQHAPGTTVELAVTWLDAAQLEVMHATEGGYHYAAIEEIDLVLDEGGRMDSIHLYVGREGHLVHDGRAVALAEVAARERPHRAHNTAEVLEIVRRRIAPDSAPEDFILRVIDDEGYRHDCSVILTADSVAFGFPFRKMPGVAEPVR